MRQEKIMTANMCGENISNFDQKNIKMCPDGWIEFFSHNKMGYPDMGNLWKYGIMLKAHNCMFMKEEMTATANSWRGIIENLYFEIDNVYALSMCLRILNVLVACRWWWFRWKWLHASDGVYIFPVSESSILQSTALLHLFQENI